MKECYHDIRFDSCKYAKKVCRQGSSPDLAGSLQRSLDPLAGFGEGEERRGGKEKGKVEEGREGNRSDLQAKILATALVYTSIITVTKITGEHWIQRITFAAKSNATPSE